MEVVVLFWLGFSIVVGVAANARGRSGPGWFLLSLIISPLIALLLVLVMQSKNAVSVAAAPAAAFEPDSAHAGIPYRVQSDGSIEAVMQGVRVRFSDQDKFAAAAGTPLPERLLPPPTQVPRDALSFDRRPWAWVVFGGAFLLLFALANKPNASKDSPREAVNTSTSAKVLATTKAMEDANAAYNRGDYPAAIKMYRDMAAYGNPRAQLSVGLMYLGGQGVVRDLVVAQEWFKSAAANAAADQATRAEANAGLDVIAKRAR
ncbi:hypothetical protein [Bradyrhizobium brasilense]|uniref:Sel1 repeat family protein n=1 Tax=Bradyrhizobium brasilense TaxID=1419277 RepID=A0ABY8JE20_9BRAD|nr:hypothetical protein [Bradyrhizobium brasilense]WFU62701.1 hypothetical protein QA636_35520 [Bradyrhizobium brasilense]